MKTALIFTILIVLVYSDNIPSNLPKEYYEMIELQEKCSEAEENKNQCLSITLSNRNYKCCMVEIINDDHYDYDRDYSCIVTVSDTNLLRETYNNIMFKAQLREMFRLY